VISYRSMLQTMISYQTKIQIGRRVLIAQQFSGL